MINIRLSKDTNGNFDVTFEDGKIRMAEDGTAAATAMTERVLLFREEAVASPIVDTNKDPEAGTDWYGTMFRADASKAEKEAEMKRVILSTTGIERILEWSYIQTGRTSYMDYAVKTLWGDVSVNQEVTPL